MDRNLIFTKYMLDELRKLLKHSSIYGAGNVLGKIVGFLMIPFYTHYLSPADYGTLELLDLSLSLTALVLTMWLNASIVRLYNDYEDTADRNQAVSTILIFAFMVGVIVGSCGIAFSRPLASLILRRPDLGFFVTLEALNFLASTVNVVCMSYLRARQKSAFVVGAGFVSLFLSLSLNVYFIAVRHNGVVGVLYSGLISTVLVTIPLVAHTLREVRFSFSYEKLKGIAQFGTPLIFTSVAAFTVNCSDRFFLQHFATISTVGVYALGYKFGFMLSLLVVQPFDMIWQARIYEIARRSHSGEMFSRLFEYYCFVLVMAALGLSLVIKDLLVVMSGPGFQTAYKVVPVVALAYLFQGTNRFFLAGSYIAKKTMRLGMVGVASAAANIALNFLLIPRFGMLGAAWATAASFLFMSSLAYLVSQKAYPIPYVFSRVVMLIGLAIVFYFASNLLSLPSVVAQISVKLALFAAFPIALYLFGFFHEREVQRARALMLEFMGRARWLRPAESGD